MTEYFDAVAQFDAAIASAKGADEAFSALQKLTEQTVGVKLFTFMTVDMQAEVARRVEQTLGGGEHAPPACVVEGEAAALRRREQRPVPRRWNRRFRMPGLR